MLTLGIQSRKFEGLFNSDTEVSVIALKHWPLNCTLQDIPDSPKAIDDILPPVSVHQRGRFLKCLGQKYKQTAFLSHVAPDSLNLCRCDLQKQWRAEFHIPCLPPSHITSSDLLPYKAIPFQHRGFALLIWDTGLKCAATHSIR